MEDVMDNIDVSKEIKDTMAKVQGAINLLKDGKQVLVNNKLLGIQQKLNTLLLNLEKKI
jgi:hypothetical protein